MRKLTMLATAAIAALAFAGLTATSASADAPFELYKTDWSGELCPEVTLNDGVASGGCLTADFDGSFELGAFTPQWYRVNSFDSTFDLILDGDGDGYAINPTVVASGPGLQRVACDQADGTVLPWAVNARAPDYFTLELDITVGLRTPASGPGGFCSQQTITVEMHQTGSNYMPSPEAPTELDQTAPSANLDNGYWTAPSLGMEIVI